MLLARCEDKREFDLFTLLNMMTFLASSALDASAQKS